MSAELLMFALLSALPIALCVTALLGQLRGVLGTEVAGRVEQWALTQVGSVLGETSPVLDIVRDVFAAPSGRALTVGLVFAAYAASRGFISLVGSLDVVFSTTSTRNWVTQRLMGVWLTFLSLVMLSTSLTLVYSSRALAHRVTSDPVLRFLLDKTVSLSGYALAVLWLATLYHLAPRDKLRWGDHLFGAAVCVGLVATLTRVMRWWVGVFGANAVFGVIGAAMSLLWWAYLASCCVFVGAEITARRRRSRALGDEQ